MASLIKNRQSLLASNKVGTKEIIIVPKPRERAAQLLKALDVTLPQSLQHLQVKVATKKKLPERRK